MSLFHARWRERVALLAGGALHGAEAGVAEAHVRDCAECREELGQARAALDLVARDPVRRAEPPLALGALVTRVRARLDEAVAERRPARVRRTVIWATSVGAAAALAVVALRTRPPEPVPPPTPATRAAVPQIPDAFLRRLERNAAREQAARYLDEAGDVLVTVAARPRHCRRGEERVDIGEEARRSRELLARRSLLLDVDPEAVASARPVLDDVEQVLREVASLESCARKRELESINRQIERRRLLLKIDLMTRELVG